MTPGNRGGPRSAVAGMDELTRLGDALARQLAKERRLPTAERERLRVARARRMLAALLHAEQGLPVHALHQEMRTQPEPQSDSDEPDGRGELDDRA